VSDGGQAGFLQGMGAGELGDLGLALVREVFEPGIRAAFDAEVVQCGEKKLSSRQSGL